jgi:hypothetical protein
VFWDGENDLWEAVIRLVQRSQITEFLGIDEIPDDPTVN